MSEGPDPYRELRHIGTKLEAALHDAGYLTWADLAEADADALVRLTNEVRSTSLERVVIWKTDAASRIPRPQSAISGADVGLERGEQNHAFVVSVVVDDDGQVVRSSVNNVRTGVERSWRGWQIAGLAAFVETEAGVLKGSALPHRTLAAIDVGTVLGGRRPLSITVSADKMNTSGPLGYQARLSARPVGESQSVIVAVRRGETDGDHDLSLDFGEIEVPTGVHRLSLDVEVVPVP